MQGTPRELAAVIDAPNAEKATEALSKNKKFTSQIKLCLHGYSNFECLANIVPQNVLVSRNDMVPGIGLMGTKGLLPPPIFSKEPRKDKGYKWVSST